MKPAPAYEWAQKVRQVKGKEAYEIESRGFLTLREGLWEEYPSEDRGSGDRSHEAEKEGTLLGKTHFGMSERGSRHPSYRLSLFLRTESDEKHIEYQAPVSKMYNVL